MGWPRSGHGCAKPVHRRPVQRSKINSPAVRSTKRNACELHHESVGYVVAPCPMTRLEPRAHEDPGTKLRVYDDEDGGRQGPPVNLYEHGGQAAGGIQAPDSTVTAEVCDQKGAVGRQCDPGWSKINSRRRRAPALRPAVGANHRDAAGPAPCTSRADTTTRR